MRPIFVSSFVANLSIFIFVCLSFQRCLAGWLGRRLVTQPFCPFQYFAIVEHEHVSVHKVKEWTTKKKPIPIWPYILIEISYAISAAPFFFFVCVLSVPLFTVYEYRRSPAI